MVSAIIQARTGSTRLPGKVFATIEGKPLLWHVVERLKPSRFIDNIVIATTINREDDAIKQWATQNSILCYRGSEDNVLERYWMAANNFQSDTIIRITADDPCKDYKIIDSVVEALLNGRVDFAYNNKPPTYPEGMDVEVFTIDALRIAYRQASRSDEKEHVTPFFHNNPTLFTSVSIKHTKNLSNLRLTIDEESDLLLAREIYSHLYRLDSIFLLDDIIDIINRFPELANINKSIKRSLMYNGGM